MVADFFIIRRQQFSLPEFYKVGGIYWYTYGINWRAMMALVLSIVPNLPGLANSVTPKLYVPQGAKDLYTMSWLGESFLISEIIIQRFPYIFLSWQMNLFWKRDANP
jgi:NCS1 family nucleobase:cation symporter-1